MSSPATSMQQLSENFKNVGPQKTHKSCALSQKNGKEDTQKNRKNSHYLEPSTKTYIPPETENCGQFAKVATCKGCGKKYLKLIFCGKPWCPNCQSIFHSRRIVRWLPKALTMESFGYFVFTVPEEMREFYKDKAHLSELRTYLRRRLKQVYPDIKALCRWHFFGDNPHIFHPHFNVIIGNFEKLPKEELSSIKRDYKRALERFTGIKLNKKINVHYEYCSPKGFKKQYSRKHKALTDEQAQKLYYKALYHKLRYVTRPTFTVYHERLAKKLKGFKNSSVWGQFRQLSYEEIESMAKKRQNEADSDLTLLKAGRCPCCGEKLHWSKNLYPGSISQRGREIGDGYFEIEEDIPSPRGSPRPNFDSLKELLREKKAQNSNWYNLQKVMDDLEKGDEKK